MENLKERYLRCVLGSQDVLGTQAAKDVCFKSVFESRGIFPRRSTTNGRSATGVGRVNTTFKRERNSGSPLLRGVTVPGSAKASLAAARRTQSARARRSTKTGSQKAESRPQLQSPEILQ
jgi:hypothetical protein